MTGIILVIGDLFIRAFLSFFIVLFFNSFFQLKMSGKKSLVFFIVVFLVVSATLPVIVNYWISR